MRHAFDVIRRALIVLIGALMGCTAAQAALVAQYTMDEGAGPTCGDTSGNGCNAAMIGSTDWVDGHDAGSPGALSFDGSCYLQAKDSPALNAIAGAFSLTAWIKPEQDSTHDTLVWKSGAFRVWKQNTNLMITIDGVASDGIVVPAALVNDTWQHVTVTFDGRYVRGYLNGVYKRRLNALGTIAYNINPLRIGWYSSTPHFQGIMDNLRLYDHALSSTEILADMNSDAPAAPSPFAIVQSGTVQTAIVTPDGCADAITQAAELLRDTVQRACGMAPGIYSESSKPTGFTGLIYVGNCDAAYNAGIDMDFFSGCNYVIRQVGSDLFLVGNDVDALAGSGTYFAVSEFLSQTLHARWLWPGDTGIYVPTCSDIVISDQDRIVIQQLKDTRIRVGGVLAADEGWNSTTVKAAFLAAQTAWMWNNQMGGSSTTALQYPEGFLDYWDRFGSTQPQYFNRLPDGTRRPDPYYANGSGHVVSMSVAKPALWAQVVDDWIADGANTGASTTPWIDAKANDTWGKCTDPCSLAWDVEPPDFQATYGCTWANRLTAATTAFGDGVNGDFWWFNYLGPMGDRYAKFWLAVQNEAISRGYGDAVVCAYAYQNYRHAPLSMAGQLNDRIFIEIVPRETTGNETFFPLDACQGPGNQGRDRRLARHGSNPVPAAQLHLVRPQFPLLLCRSTWRRNRLRLYARQDHRHGF